MDIKKSLQPYQQYLSHIIGQLKDKNCQSSAAALTYMTLFAIVPLMTVIYSMFSLVPIFQGVEKQLENLFQNYWVNINEDNKT